MEEIILMILVAAAALVGLTLVVHMMVYLIRLTRAGVNPERTKPEPSALISHFIISVIVLVFATIAIPNFLKTNCPPWPFENPDCRQSEAKTNLGAIYVAQLSYFSNNNTYASGPDTFKLINWEPSGQNRYAYYCQGAMIPNKLSWKNGSLPDHDYRWPSDYKPGSSQSGFTCVAVGNIDNDSDLDVWAINDAKILTNPGNDR